MESMTMKEHVERKNKAAAKDIKKEESKGGELVTVKVWDVPTRVLHWVNALLVITLVVLIAGYEWGESFGLSEAMAERFEELHAVFGTAFVVTFFLRIVWGFFGNTYAKFTDMIPYTKKRIKAVLDNLRWYLGGCRNEPPVCVGHNPLASLFYLALFVVLALQAVTGILLAGIEFDMFPGTLITGGMGTAGVEFMEGVAEEIHEFGLWFIIFFFVAHIGGLIVHTIHDRGALVLSMITGKKHFKKSDLEL